MSRNIAEDSSAVSKAAAFGCPDRSLFSRVYSLEGGVGVGVEEGIGESFLEEVHGNCRTFPGRGERKKL